MVKRGRKEKDNWKKKRRQEYLEKKEFRYYIFCEGQAMVLCQDLVQVKMRFSPF